MKKKKTGRHRFLQCCHGKSKRRVTKSMGKSPRRDKKE